MLAQSEQLVLCTTKTAKGKLQRKPCTLGTEQQYPPPPTSLAQIPGQPALSLTPLVKLQFCPTTSPRSQGASLPLDTV